MTASEKNVASLKRLFDGVWNGEDRSVAEELVAADYVIHDRELAEQLRGPELYRALACAGCDWSAQISELESSLSASASDNRVARGSARENDVLSEI